MPPSPPRSDLPPPDAISIDVVAARLGKTRRWLQDKLREDNRRPRAERRLQFHDKIGRDPQWTEEGYQALQAALTAPPVRRQIQPAAGTVIPSTPRERQAAFDEVMSFPLTAPKAGPARGGSSRALRRQHRHKKP